MENKNVYVGHRYVPKIMGEHDKTQSYEGLSIVTHEGNSYTSKKRVPVGVDISNTEYWVVTGNYNAQIDYYRDETRVIKENMNNLEKNIDVKMDNFNEITTDNIIKTSEKIGKGTRVVRDVKPMVSIVDDDGNAQFMDKWYHLLKEENFKIDISAITSLVGTSGFLTWEQLKYLNKNYNVDVINHSHTHPDLNSISDDKLHYEYSKSINELYKNGFNNGDILVYPRGLSNFNSRRIARQYFRAGLLDLGGSNRPPLYTFNLRRTKLYGNEPENIETLKGYVDKIIENTGWLIFISHSQFNGFDKAILKELIQYINSKNVEWVHVNEGLEKMGNVFEYGDNEDTYENGEPERVNYPYKVIDANGVTKSNITTDIHIKDDVLFDTPLSEFERGKLTHSVILTNNPSIKDFAGAGTLETYHHFNPVYSYQKLTLYNKTEVYMRRWNNNQWTKFELISGDEVTIDDKPLNSSILEYKEKSVSYTTITSNNKDYSNSPGGSGILKTVRVSGVGYSYQIFKSTSSNNEYIRKWENGKWGSFERRGISNIIHDDNKTVSNIPSDFISGVITITNITNENSGSLPEGGGQLTTYRFGNYDYNYQTYKPTSSDKMYIRSSNPDGSTWSSFKINGV